MVENARSRFAEEIRSGRLTLLNVGISSEPGNATFWMSDKPEWCSFDRQIASRDGTAHRPVTVRAVLFGQILEKYGVPHYLKVDIEGNDRLCVETLRGTTIPQYISVETECVGDSAVLSEEESLSMLELLRKIGYHRFKLVDQTNGWTPVRPSGVARLSVRLANRLACGRLRIRGLSGMADRFTDSTRIAGLKFNFCPGSSGPWGNDIPGAWMQFEKARSAYLRERRAFCANSRPLYSFWYDWHATY